MNDKLIMNACTTVIVAIGASVAFYKAAIEIHKQIDRNQSDAEKLRNQEASKVRALELERKEIRDGIYGR